MPRKLDLRSGRPVWFAYRAPKVAHTALTRDIRTDVLVVGAGISGAMIAEALTAAGHEVTIIDRRGPGKGSTAATTALVQFEIDKPLTTLSRMIGRGDAERAWRRSRLAVANLAGHIAERGIACGMAQRSSLYLAGTVLGASQLREEAQARRLAGVGATYLTAGDLSARFDIARDGAILSHANLALDPRKLTAGLLNLALSRKARLHAPVEATSFEHGKDEVQVGTKAGPVIRAGHVVLATGYELTAIVPAARHSIVSTWAMATRPQPRNLWPGAALVWEASDPYLYARATADGRVICGGEDEDFSDEARRDDLIAQKTDTIARKIGRLFPRIDPTPAFRWTGSFGATPTGLPYIGAIPRHPRIHAVMGYGGNGITFSRIASELVSAALEGRRDADADLFAFTP